MRVHMSISGVDRRINFPPVLFRNSSTVIDIIYIYHIPIQKMDIDCMSKLKFISNIKNGDKISVKTLTIQKDSMLTKLTRSLTGHENREGTIIFIASTLQKAYDTYHKCQDDAIKKLLIDDMKAATSGIIALQFTYAIDQMTVCRLCAITQELSLFLEKVNS